MAFNFKKREKGQLPNLACYMTGQQLEFKLDCLKRDIEGQQDQIAEIFEDMRAMENHPELGADVRPAFFEEDPKSGSYDDPLMGVIKRLEQLKAQHAVVESEIEFRASLKQEESKKKPIRMGYDLKAHPTRYNGVNFRSRLEARWAAYFDLQKINWEYEPIDLIGWSPDFLINFTCVHLKCRGDDWESKAIEHRILVEVKPYIDLGQFDGLPCHQYDYHAEGRANVVSQGFKYCGMGRFGFTPDVAEFGMIHAGSGGYYGLDHVERYDRSRMWAEAINLVQWKPNAD
jgi:hypothetical protein